MINDTFPYRLVIVFISLLCILPVFLYADTYVRGAVTYIAFVTSQYILENSISVELECPHSARLFLDRTV